MWGFHMWLAHTKSIYISINYDKKITKVLKNIEICFWNLTNKILNKKFEQASVHIKILHRVLYLKCSQEIPNQDF